MPFVSTGDITVRLDPLLLGTEHSNQTGEEAEAQEGWGCPKLRSVVVLDLDPKCSSIPLNSWHSKASIRINQSSHPPSTHTEAESMPHCMDGAWRIPGREECRLCCKRQGSAQVMLLFPEQSSCLSSLAAGRCSAGLEKAAFTPISVREKGYFPEPGSGVEWRGEGLKRRAQLRPFSACSLSISRAGA